MELSTTLVQALRFNVRNVSFSEYITVCVTELQAAASDGLLSHTGARAGMIIVFLFLHGG